MLELVEGVPICGHWPEAEVVLIDFGACSIDGRRRGLRTGELTAWIAPELRNGEAGSAKSDVYAVGMTAL